MTTDRTAPTCAYQTCEASICDGSCRCHYVTDHKSDAEWAASLTVADLDLILNRCVHERDFQGLSAALHLMAVKNPDRADYWRNTLLLAVEVGRARHEETR